MHAQSVFKIRHLIILFVLFISSELYAQNTVSIGTDELKSSAVLYLKGNGSQAFIIPIVDAVNQVSNPEAGMVVYQSSDNKVYFHSGSQWSALGDTGTGGGSTYSLQYNAGTNQLTLLEDGSGTPITLSSDALSLNGIDLPSGDPENDQILVYNGSIWEYQALPTGTFNGVTVDGTTIQGDGLSTPLSVVSVNDADADATNELQNLSLTGNTLNISNGTGVDLTPVLGTGGADQTLSLVGNDLTISGTGGNSVDLSSIDTDTKLTEAEVDAFVNNNGYLTSEVDGSITNEIQNLSLTGATLNISGGTGVDLAPLIPPGGTDDQNLVLTGDVLSIEGGTGSVDLSGYIDDADADATNEIQDLSLTGNTLSLTGDGTTVDLSGFIDNTDAQGLSLTGTTLNISGGTGVDLAPIIPPGGTDDQNLVLTGDVLSIEGGTGSVDLSTYVDDADADAANELQDLSLTGTTLNISGGAGVDLAPIIPAGSTDDQNLVLTGDVLSIEGGTGSVDLSTYVNDADADPTNEIQNAAGVAVTPTGNLASNNTQAALVELQTDIDGIAALPAMADGQIIVSSGTTPQAVSMSGDMVINNTGLTAIQDDAVQLDDIQDNGATRALLANSSAGVVTWLVPANDSQLLGTNGAGDLTFIDQSNFNSIDQTTQAGILVGNGSVIGGVTATNNALFRGNGTTLVPSTIQDDGSSVGIGALDNTYLFNVNGESNFNDVVYFGGNPGIAGNILISDAGTGPPVWTDPSGLGFATDLQSAYDGGNTIQQDGTNDLEVISASGALTQFYIDDATNDIGIGTNTPTVVLDVRGENVDDGGLLNLGNSDNSMNMLLFSGRTSDPNPFIQVAAGRELRFANSSSGFTEMARFDANGNLGLGTSDPLSRFQIENTFGIFYDENQGQDIIAHNVYENGVGDFRYATTAGASIITIMPERVGFFTFPSGTADASLSGFSTRMNLTSDGLVINGDNLNTSSVLDINSTTKGILVPRLTTVQRDAIASPATGLMVYNSTTNGFNFFNGSIWTSFGGGVSDLQGAYDGGNTINLTSSDFSIRNSGGGLDYFNVSEVNGNIGIGTTTNGDAITVDKASDAVMNMISSNAALGTQVGLRLAMSTGAIGTVYRMFAEKNDATPGSTNADLIMRKEFSTGGGYLEFLKYDNATNGLVFNSGNTSATLYSNVLVNAGNLEMNEGIVFNDDDNSNTITLETPTNITADYTLTFPAALGSAGQVLATDASGNLGWVSVGSSGWGLTGNSGTTAGTNFLGTTDTQPLEVKVDNTRVMRFEYDAGTAEPSPNIIGGHPSNSIGVGLAGVTISGGGYTNANIGSGNWATIGGGRDNQAGAASNGNYSTISGGASNLSTFQFSSVGGGRSNNASGRGATIPGGLFLSASSFGMTAVGTANETTVYTPNSWVDTEPIFVVGNGEVDASNNIISNSNAMTILKNGNVGIGSTTPAAALEVKSGAVTTVDASGQLINSMTTSGDNAGEFNVYGTNGLLNAALQNLGGSPNNGQLVLYNAAEQGQVILRSYSDGSGERGEVYFRGDNGNFNAFIGSMSTAVDNGQITLFNSAGAAKYIARADTDNAGKLILRGASGSSNVEMTIADGDSDKGKVLVADATGTERAYMKVNSTGVGEIFASSVGIGTTPTSASLDIVGNIKITDGTQAAGRVLTSDANGLASWQDASASGWGLTGNSGTNSSTNFIGTTDAVDLSFRVNNVASGKVEINNLTANTFLGYSSGSSNSGEFNTGIGWSTLQSNTGHSNTAIGGYTMLDNIDGFANTAVGRDAMRGNTSGAANTAIGVTTLYRNTTGNSNTAVGGSTMFENITGNENTALGNQALSSNTAGSNNTATGFYALLQNTANNNVANGARALADNTTGTGNTAVGYFAGYTTTFANANTTGSDNTFIGYNSGPGSTTQLTNATAIGANARVTQSNSLILGNGVNVGIGTTTPSAKLDIQSTGNILINAEGNNGIGTWLNLYNNATGGRQYGLISSADGNGEGAGRFMFYDHTAGSSRMAINSAGDVGIGTTAPSQRLHVIGNILASGTITPSDIRYKKSIGPLDNVLQNISKLRGVSYYHKVADFPDLGLSEGMQIGVIAQEVEEIYPQLVVTDDKGYKAVEYSKLTPILLEAIKEQQKIIDSLMLSDVENKKKIEALESTVNSSKGSNEMEALQSQLDLMKSQIEKLTAILTAEASKGNE